MICFLVENGVDALARTRHGDTLLHIVLRSLDDDNDALEAVKLLVGYGCNPLEVNSRGKTPLCVAVQLGGHLSVARYLLTLGALLPRDLLVTWGGCWRRSTAPILRFLVENGVDVLARDSCRDSASGFHIPLQSSRNENEVLEAVKLLVGYGCNPLAAKSQGETPLCVAVKRGYLLLHDISLPLVLFSLQIYYLSHGRVIVVGVGAQHLTLSTSSSKTELMFLRAIGAGALCSTSHCCTSTMTIRPWKWRNS